MIELPLEVDIAFSDAQGQPWRLDGQMIRLYEDFDDQGRTCVVIVGDLRPFG